MTAAGALVPLSAVPQMSWCQVCPDPGRCCRRFILTGPDGFEVSFWERSWRADADAWLAEQGLPFQPIEVRERFHDEDSTPYVVLWFTCPRVDSSGRCSIYAARPQVCREFVPGRGGLCCI